MWIALECLTTEFIHTDWQSRDFLINFHLAGVAHTTIYFHAWEILETTQCGSTPSTSRVVHPAFEALGKRSVGQHIRAVHAGTHAGCKGCRSEFVHLLDVVINLCGGEFVIIRHILNHRCWIAFHLTAIDEVAQIAPFFRIRAKVFNITLLQIVLFPVRYFLLELVVGSNTSLNVLDGVGNLGAVRLIVLSGSLCLCNHLHIGVDVTLSGDFTILECDVAILDRILLQSGLNVVIQQHLVGVFCDGAIVFQREVIGTNPVGSTLFSGAQTQLDIATRVDEDHFEVLWFAITCRDVREDVEVTTCGKEFHTLHRIGSCWCLSILLNGDTIHCK